MVQRPQRMKKETVAEARARLLGDVTGYLEGIDTILSEEEKQMEKRVAAAQDHKEREHDEPLGPVHRQVVQSRAVPRKVRAEYERHERHIEVK